MGLMSLLGMRESASDEDALRWHLQYNMFPAGSGNRLEHFDTCMLAIKQARKGEMDTPAACGIDVVDTERVIEHFKLDGFLMEDDTSCDTES